jgi:predicted RNA-binding Zn ribbon-like protein
MDFDVTGGSLSLNFVNTVDRWFGDGSVSGEMLTSHDELLAWARTSGALDAHAYKEAVRAKHAPAEVEHAQDLRKILWLIANAHVHGEKAPPAALRELNRQIATMLPQQLTQSSRGFELQAQKQDSAFENLRDAILRDFVDLCCSPRLAKLRQCSAADCGWIFLDTSKNHSRRWCSMQDCGNREKARRHYQRS